MCFIGKIFQLVFPCMKMNSSGASKLTLSSEDETFLRQRVFTPCWYAMSISTSLLSYMLIAFLLIWTFEKTSTGQQWMNCTHVKPESQHKLSSRDCSAALDLTEMSFLCVLLQSPRLNSQLPGENLNFDVSRSQQVLFFVNSLDLNRQKNKLIFWCRCKPGMVLYFKRGYNR